MGSDASALALRARTQQIAGCLDLGRPPGSDDRPHGPVRTEEREWRRVGIAALTWKQCNVKTAMFSNGSCAGVGIDTRGSEGGRNGERGERDTRREEAVVVKKGEAMSGGGRFVGLDPTLPIQGGGRGTAKRRLSPGICRAPTARPDTGTCSLSLTGDFGGALQAVALPSLAQRVSVHHRRWKMPVVALGR